MGLLKQIELESGITVNYHRVVSINKITNNRNIVEVASYTSKEKREEEIEKIQSGEPMNVFIDTTYVGMDYDEDISIKEVYDYLKTTEKFKDAVDA